MHLLFTRGAHAWHVAVVCSSACKIVGTGLCENNVCVCQYNFLFLFILKILIKIINRRLNLV